MDGSTPDPRLTAARQRVGRDMDSYLEQQRQHHEAAAAALAETPPDYSAAATACHRALQFRRQAEALAWVTLELGR